MCTWRLHNGAVDRTELSIPRAIDVAKVDEIIKGKPHSVKREVENGTVSVGVWVFQGAASERLCAQDVDQGQHSGSIPAEGLWRKQD